MTLRPLLATAAAATLCVALLTSCAPRIVPEPSPAPARPAPPPPPPPPPPLAADWQDWPVTSGTWRYRKDASSSEARFGPPESETDLSISCDFQSRRMAVTLFGAAGADGGGMMTIRTSYGALQWPVVLDQDGYGAATATRAASDPGLDQIAFSRGRIALELPGQTPVVVPVWAEIARVIEDCRG